MLVTRKEDPTKMHDEGQEQTAMMQDERRASSMWCTLASRNAAGGMSVALRQFMYIENHKALVLEKVAAPTLRGERSVCSACVREA